MGFSKLMGIKNKVKKGFTLVELIISVGILSVAGAFILLFFAYSKDINTRAYDLDNSVYHSNYIIELLKAELWDEEPLIDMRVLETSKPPDSISKEIRFDNKWEYVELDEGHDYVLNLNLERNEDGVNNKDLYDVTIEVIKTKPYFRSLTKNMTIYSMETKVYIYLEEGDSYD